MEAVVEIKESGGFSLEGLSSTQMQPNLDGQQLQQKQRYRFVCATTNVNICPQAGAHSLYLLDSLYNVGTHKMPIGL